MKFFYGPEADMFTFFKIPKLLFAEPYKHISTDAKLLYGLMLDRMGLSAQNERWTDEDGRVYIYFPIAEVMDLLGISDKSATKLYKELESVELIQRKRQGLGKPTKIYVSKFFKVSPGDFPGDFAENVEKEAAQTNAESLNRKKSESRNGKNPNQETGNSRIPPFNKKTEVSENESNYSMMNPLTAAKPARKSPEPVLEGVERMEARVRIQISYDVLRANHPGDGPAIDNLVTLIADVLTSRKPSYRINGELRNGDEVRRRLQRLQYEDIEAVLDAFFHESTDKRIRNVRAYLITALYNAPGSSEQYLTHNLNIPNERDLL